MQRDMDLIRKLLRVIEEDQAGHAPQVIAIDGYSSEQIGYHIWLLGQSGLLNTETTTHLLSPSPSAMPVSLTWEGHEFLEASRNDGAWKKAKGIIIEKGGGMTLEVIKAFLMAEIKRQIGVG